MTKQTALHSRHVAAGARMVDFGGWDMPLHYGSQIDEHHAVRAGAGIFDVSHMTVVDVGGAGARGYLQRLLANDVGKLEAPGKGLYGCMLDAAGGIIDDLITYRRADGQYRVVVNAATRDADLTWMNDVADGFDISLVERPELIMLAIQGPRAVEFATPLLPATLREAAASLESFGCVETDGVFVARTGYTGEDGFEIILNEAEGLRLWDDAITAGIAPCGLGARDTLRLEAGLCLYGQDMDTTTSPLVSGLGWTVAWQPADRDFVGRAALEREKRDGAKVKLVGLILDDRGIMRHGQRVATAAGDGVVTSGGFSPTIQRSIALARIPGDAADVCQVEIRNVLRQARIVRPTFVRNGKILVSQQGEVPES
jgi:aminomethyltransferase